VPTTNHISGPLRQYEDWSTYDVIDILNQDLLLLNGENSGLDYCLKVACDIRGGGGGKKKLS